MAVLSKDEFDFDKIEFNGEPLPPFADEVLTPEIEDNYWEIHYPNGMVMFLTGNIQVMAHTRELKSMEGGKREGLKKKVTELSSKKKDEVK